MTQPGSLRPAWVVVSALAIEVAIVASLVSGCASDTISTDSTTRTVVSTTMRPSTAISPAPDPATTTTATTTTGPSETTTTTLAWSAESPDQPDLRFFGPFHGAARFLPVEPGDLPVPDGWQLGIADDELLMIYDGGPCRDPQADGACNASDIRWIDFGLMRAGEEHGFDAGVTDPADVEAALRDLVDRFYKGREHARGWNRSPFDFVPIEPTPAAVGSLTGLHFGYHGDRDGELVQHTDGYLAYDGSFLYLVMVRLPGTQPKRQPFDAIAEFAPYLREIVASLPLPVAAEALLPDLESDWSLESGDILSSGRDGIAILRGDPAAGDIAAVISTEPTAQAYHDRMDGIVLRRARWSYQEPPWETAVWWVPGPGVDPVVLYEPAPDGYVTLFGVAEIEDRPHAVYVIDEPGEFMGYHVLVAHDLVSDEPRRVGAVGAGEVRPRCVSWAIDRFLLSLFAEENTYFEFVSLDGEGVEPGIPTPEALQGSHAPAAQNHADTCAALRDSDGTVAVVLREIDGPNHLVIVDMTTGQETLRIEIDLDLPEESYGYGWFPRNTRVDFLGEQVLVSNIVFDHPDQFVVDLATGEITMIPVDGMATWVR